MSRLVARAAQGGRYAREKKVSAQPSIQAAASAGIIASMMRAVLRAWRLIA